MGVYCDGKIGIERESLRIDASGRLSRRKNPFEGNPDITMDVCECQCEMITQPQSSPADAMAQLRELTVFVQQTLSQLETPELLWPFSTPPAITGEEEIIPACFGGEDHPETLYRKHLFEVYEKNMLAISGIHVNISLPGDLMLQDFSESRSETYVRFREQQYLRVASGLYEYGWIITVLTAASPTEDASVRCGRNGFWNTFVPILNFNNYHDYLDSIQDYMDQRMLYRASELYIPIRLRLADTMTWDGTEPEISHIEIRNIDLNPYEPTGLNFLDLRFIHLLTQWIYGQYQGKLDAQGQRRCIENFKTAAMYDIESARIISADLTEKSIICGGMEILDRMEQFFSKSGKVDIDDIRQVIAFQRDKLYHPQKRYAAIIRNDFENDYSAKGIQQAKTLQQQALR